MGSAIEAGSGRRAEWMGLNGRQDSGRGRQEGHTQCIEIFARRKTGPRPLDQGEMGPADGMLGILEWSWKEFRPVESGMRILGSGFWLLGMDGTGTGNGEGLRITGRPSRIKENSGLASLGAGHIAAENESAERNTALTWSRPCFCGLWTPWTLWLACG